MQLALRLVLAMSPLLVSLSPALAQSPKLTPGARVAIIGDSITEQKLYSRYMEAYLLASSGVPDIKVFQFGWSGETAGGFANRCLNDLEIFKPTVATTCYGMNDGGYQPYKPQVGQNYEANMRAVVKQLAAAGVKTIVLGSPGAVDHHFFRPGQKLGDLPAHEAYNDNLAHLRDIDRKLADEFHQSFANVHDAMVDAMKKAQASLGPKYDVCGGDGFHPGPNGQLIMAYAFLKGLGVDGQIGEIVIDIKGEATAAGGHKIVSAKDGNVEVESARWPFCFEGDGKSSNSTRSILPFLPFNAELNRFTLKVKGLEAAKAKVTWGSETKEFTRDQLAAGVNLAAEFTKTPFDESFGKLSGAIAQKQNFETQVIKNLVTHFRNVPGDLKEDAELKQAFSVVKNRLAARHQELDAQVRTQLKPVTHTLKIEAVN